jgi:hypothetical protein
MVPGGQPFEVKYKPPTVIPAYINVKPTPIEASVAFKKVSE